MATIRDNILNALVARLATIPGWTAQLRGLTNGAPNATVLAVVCFLTEDKSLATNDQYQASMQVLVWIRGNPENADATLDGGNAFRYLDRLVALAEQQVHDPDEWGIEPAFTEVQINGHDVLDPANDHQVQAELRLTFTYRHHYQDPGA
ncbi:MAG: hypothetical protein JNK15_03120 [Planctomycetes bacterium]|nr:hypothetical protein [Planctomycetota bacterium]